jgi:beta-glucosidase
MNSPPLSLKFPDGFFWGASTSSHQVEGGTDNDWTEWETSSKRLKALGRKGLIEKNGISAYVSGRACDHYNRFEDDFRLARSLGHNAHRFSVEWSRIEPEEGVFNEKEIIHYQSVVRTLRENGMEPFVTIYHWTVPRWFNENGGWLSYKAPARLARFAEKITSSLKEHVRFFITLNEPEIFATHPYLIGDWPPCKGGLLPFFRCIDMLVKAHNKSYDAMKSVAPGSLIGIAKHNLHFETARNTPVNRFLKNFADRFWNFDILNRIGSRQDFIGLNHYGRNLINNGFGKNTNQKVSDLGWELYPEAIYHVLKDLKRYNKPIYICENGLADKDDIHRSWFITETLRNVHKAIQDGCDVKGYLHWSLLDNFEWAEGFLPRFGLVEVDYKTMERKPRPSAEVYSSIIKASIK